MIFLHYFTTMPLSSHSLNTSWYAMYLFVLNGSFNFFYLPLFEQTWQNPVLNSTSPDLVFLYVSLYRHQIQKLLPIFMKFGKQESWTMAIKIYKN